MKKLFVLFCLFGLCLGMQARKQWTEKQAWQWQERVGVLKGFNEPYPAYPSQTLDEILQKASSLGFNSVRFWTWGITPEQQIDCIRQHADIAAKYGMTISPVISRSKDLCRKYCNEGKEFPWVDYEKEVRTVMKAFANDKRIAYWDLANEPDYTDKPETYAEMDMLEKMVEWCRAENVCQPITSSIIWDYPNPSNKALKRISEIEKMMDVHNFHTYDCASHFGKNVRDEMDYIIRELGNRPMICSECLTRVDGSGVARTLAAFAPYKVNFYIWGMFMNDRNWEARWDRSTMDAYEPSFHNVLYADGDPIDERELQLIRDYRFCEKFDEGIEITDRWTHERAWKWMSIGPIKGFYDGDHIDDMLADYEGRNAISALFSFNEWKTDRDAFFRSFDAFLDKYDKLGILVRPVLLDDFSTCGQDIHELESYVGDVIDHYFSDSRILAWNIFCDQGVKKTDVNRKMELVTRLFRYARQAFANQPLTMTPYVRVKKFPEGFKAWDAMVHGRTAGWDHLEYGENSSDKLVYKMWSISDVITFQGTVLSPDQAAWLGAVCYKFGRPVFCDGFGHAIESCAPTDYLNRFAQNHVFWFYDGELPREEVARFRFIPVSTQRQGMATTMVE